MYCNNPQEITEEAGDAMLMRWKDELPTYQRVLMAGIQLVAYREHSSR